MGTNDIINNAVAGVVAIKIIDVAGNHLNKQANKSTRHKKRKNKMII